MYNETPTMEGIPMDEELEVKIEEVKKHLTKTKVAKMIVKGTVKHCTGVVVGTALARVLPPAETKADQVRYFIGGYAIGSMVADKVGDHIADDFDRIVNAFKREKVTTVTETSDEAPVAVPDQDQPTE